MNKPNEKPFQLSITIECLDGSYVYAPNDSLLLSEKFIFDDLDLLFKQMKVDIKENEQKRIDFERNKGEIHE